PRQSRRVRPPARAGRRPKGLGTIARTWRFPTHNFSLFGCGPPPPPEPANFPLFMKGLQSGRRAVFGPLLHKLVIGIADNRAMQGRFESLDGLRGVSALAVVLYHCELLFAPGMIFCHGYLAVDLFFILSGFVIAANYE